MFYCFKFIFTSVFTFHGIAIQHVSWDVNNTKLTNHNGRISILCPSIKSEIPAYISQFVFGNKSETMVGSKKTSDKTRNEVKANRSPSVPTVKEPALRKSFPTSSSQHAVEPQSPPTTPSKGKADDIIAYVHDLSSPIQNKRKTMKYSTLTLQTESKDLHALLYSPQKRPLLEDSLRTRTPVKIRRFTHTADQAKLIINDMTDISQPSPTEYCFQYAELSTNKCTVIADILQKSNEGDSVSVLGKVGNIGEISTVRLGKQTLRMAEATIADLTGKIPISLWENNLALITMAAVYKITNTRVRFWNGAKKLTASPNSVISAIQHDKLAAITMEEDPSEAPQQDELAVVVPFIKTVEKVQQYPLCVHCSRKLLQATASVLVKCDRCKHTMVLANCNKRMSVHFTVQGQDGSDVTVTAFEQTLKTVVPTVGEMSEEQLTEHLLLLNNISIKYSSSTLIVSAIEL